MAGHADTARKLTALTGWISRHRKTRAPAGDADPVDPDLSERATSDQPQTEPTATKPRDDVEAPEEHEAAPRRGPRLRLAMVVGVIMVMALGALSGWLGYRAYQIHQAQQERNMFLQVARQGVVNLSTINFTEVDADVQRILDSSTGTFYDDFKKRSQPFIDVVKQVQSKSEGKVTEAGLESENGDQAQVLVAVAVKTSSAGQDEPRPRLWRMRISLQRVDEIAKVSNVEFVP